MWVGRWHGTYRKYLRHQLNPLFIIIPLWSILCICVHLCMFVCVCMYCIYMYISPIFQFSGVLKKIVGSTDNLCFVLVI